MVEVERVFNDIDIELLDYDIVFHGEIVDDRGGRLLDKIRDKDISVYQVRYDSHNFSLILNNVGYPVNDMAKWFSSVAGKNILIDVTTLDFPEILYLIHWINDASSSSCIDAIYIEAEEYRRQDGLLLEAEDFSLSEGRNSFGALPMYSAPQDISGTTQPVLLAPLGFEGSRLGQMLEQDDGATFSEMIGLIGAPALKPGWENRSIYSHLRYFSNVNTRLEYYSCRNPYQTLELLESIRFEADKLILAALGTKPSSLACAIFLINNFRKNTRLKMISAIYDFPVASYKRTVGVGKANLYRLNILSS